MTHSCTMIHLCTDLFRMAYVVWFMQYDTFMQYDSCTMTHSCIISYSVLHLQYDSCLIQYCTYSMTHALWHIQALCLIQYCTYSKTHSTLYYCSICCSACLIYNYFNFIPIPFYDSHTLSYMTYMQYDSFMQCDTCMFSTQHVCLFSLKVCAPSNNLWNDLNCIQLLISCHCEMKISSCFPFCSCWILYVILCESVTCVR